MSGSGVQTTNIPEVSLSDEMLVNRDGSTGRQSVSNLSAQLTGAGAIADALARLRLQVTSSSALAATWTDLVALVGVVHGNGAEVVDADTGTHGQATATGYDGAVVDNAGRYSWDAVWGRWVRVGDTLIGGLGSAAASEASDFATAAQGAKADSAAQQADMDNHKAADDQHSIGGVIGLQAALDQQAQNLRAGMSLLAAQAAGLGADLVYFADRLSINDASRPGEIPSQFSSSVVGDPVERPAIATGHRQITDDSGAVWVLAEPGIIAPRRAYTIEDGRTYLLRVVVERITNSSAPTGDAVEVWWQNLTDNKAAATATLLQSWPNLTASDHAVTYTATVSRGGPAADYSPPAGAFYGVPSVRTYGDTAATGIVAIEWLDVTDLLAAAAAETDARIAADAVLSGGIAAETDARIAADAALSGGIAAETNARIAADVIFSGGIAAEVATRAAADVGLRNLVDTKARRVDVDEAGFLVRDEGGNVALRIGADSVLRVLAAGIGDLGLSENVDRPWSVGDAAGDMLALLNSAGVMMASGFEGAGFRLRQSDVPGWAVCIHDEDGNIPWGIADDGSVMTAGSEAPETATPHNIDFMFLEGWGDASESLMLSWVNNDAAADLVGVRLLGAPNPTFARSVRTRAFPHVAGKYIHSTPFKALSAGAVYEVSWPGTGALDRFRVPPRSGVKIAALSDYQQYDFSASGLMGKFGAVVAAQGVDFMVLNGDYVNDDGVWDATQGGRWHGFLAGLAEFYRTSDGALIPFISLAGNHEGSDVSDTSNALAGGNGHIGMITEIMSAGYDLEHPERARNSVARLAIGRELLILTLETDHTEPLADQLPWLQQQLADHADDFRHVVVFGHAPAFFGGDLYELDDLNTQSRVLRNDVWPAMSPYAGKIRFYGCGHDHFLGVTARLKMDPASGATAEQNDVRWTTAADGIRQLGCGTWGGQRNELNAADMAEVSSLDGSPKFVAAMGYNAGLDQVTVHGTGLTNTTPEIWNIWIADFNAVDFTAGAYGSAGQQFYTLTETV